MKGDLKAPVKGEIDKLKAEKANKSIVSDAWKTGQTYEKGAYCIYNDRLYKALVQTTAEPTSESDWEVINIASEFASIKKSLSSLSKLRDLVVYRTTGENNTKLTVEFTTDFGSYNLPYVTFAIIGSGFMSYGRVGSIVNLENKSVSATYDENKHTVTFTLGSYPNAALLLFVKRADYFIKNITES